MKRFVFLLCAIVFPSACDQDKVEAPAGRSGDSVGLHANAEPCALDGKTSTSNNTVRKSGNSQGAALESEDLSRLIPGSRFKPTDPKSFSPRLIFESDGIVIYQYYSAGIVYDRMFFSVCDSEVAVYENEEKTQLYEVIRIYKLSGSYYQFISQRLDELPGINATYTISDDVQN